MVQHITAWHGTAQHGTAERVQHKDKDRGKDTQRGVQAHRHTDIGAHRQTAHGHGQAEASRRKGQGEGIQRGTWQPKAYS